MNEKEAEYHHVVRDVIRFFKRMDRYERTILKFEIYVFLKSPLVLSSYFVRKMNVI